MILHLVPAVERTHTLQRCYIPHDAVFEFPRTSNVCDITFIHYQLGQTLETRRALQGTMIGGKKTKKKCNLAGSMGSQREKKSPDPFQSSLKQASPTLRCTAAWTLQLSCYPYYLL